MTVDNLLDHDFNPLFMLLNTKSWGTALKELESHPSQVDGAIKLPGFYGDKKVKTSVNSLHIACKHNAPVKVIEALLSANSSMACQKDSSYQRLPLHVATLNQASFKIIGAIVKDCPRSAKIQDLHGRLPIHYACKDKKNGERYLRYLLKVYPEAAHVADDNGFLPLHVACRSGQPMVVLNMLLRVAPETIMSKTNNGATPVHCAKNCKEGGENYASVVELLKKVAEETKKLVDNQGPMSSSGATVSTGSHSKGSLKPCADYGLLRSIGANEKEVLPTGKSISVITSSSKGVPDLVSVSEHEEDSSSSSKDTGLSERSASESSSLALA